MKNSIKIILISLLALGLVTGCEKENSQSKGIFGLAAPAEQYHCGTG